MNPEIPSLRPRLAKFAPPGALLLAVVAWLWPIGFGGKIPLGGDITQFSLGLFSVLAERTRAAQLPYWNNRWGFGFPGIGESQMGVYYPPNQILYGLLSVETAFAWSLVFHTAWCALGAWWCARKFGVSPWGAVICGLAFACGGFFAIHRVHPWAATCGSWMPWAVGIAWSTLESKTKPVAGAVALSAVLAIQILPGHFQIAFITQVSILALVAITRLERILAPIRNLWFALIRVSTHKPDSIGPQPLCLQPSIAIVAATSGAFLLAAAQVWPTAHLAQRAAIHRDFGYLSAFAVPPFHLVTYLAPSLFHRSPLWRSIVWDPFHAMPEEHAGYAGLVALWLAMLAVLRLTKSNRTVRTLAILLIGTILLSFGPFMPGFRTLVALPGFSFFRAPARWGIATSLALALLAGIGFDALTSLKNIRRSLVLGALFTCAVVALTLGAIELLLADSAAPTKSTLDPAMESLGNLLPWANDNEPGYRAVMASARQPSKNPIVERGLLRLGVIPSSAQFDKLRAEIYREEVAPTALILVALLAIALLPMISRRTFIAALVVTLAAELIAFAQYREFTLAPMRPIVEQSPLLTFLSKLPRDTRTIDTLGNLPLVAGVAPLRSYRTLDIPLANFEVQRALVLDPTAPNLRANAINAMSEIGASIRIYEPRDWKRPNPLPPEFQEINDPFLADCLYGPKARDVLGPFGKTFAIWHAPAAPVLADMGPTAKDFATYVAALRRNNQPPPKPPASVVIPFRWLTPESFELDVANAQTRTIEVHILQDPQWRTQLPSPTKRTTPPRPDHRPSSVGEASWLLLESDRADAHIVRVAYQPDLERQGQIASAIAWLLWLITAISSTHARPYASRTPNPIAESKSI